MVSSKVASGLFFGEVENNCNGSHEAASYNQPERVRGLRERLSDWRYTAACVTPGSSGPIDFRALVCRHKTNTTACGLAALAEPGPTGLEVAGGGAYGERLKGAAMFETGPLKSGSRIFRMPLPSTSDAFAGLRKQLTHEFYLGIN
jgi:hypothetical protein